MKQLFTFFIISVFSLQVLAQTDSTKVKILNKNVVTVVDNENGTRVKVGNDKGIEVITDDWGDTTKVRIGNRTFKVMEDSNGTHFKVQRETRDRSWDNKFNGHWGGMEFGMNLFHDSDYSLYGGDEFMELKHGKSITVNLNFAEWAFKNKANNFALVTGLGFSFMDFTFDNPITITKQDGMIIPIDIDPEGLNKSKLNVTYLTAPLIIEIKTPLKLNGSRLYIAGGVIGGIHLGSHTKYKYNRDKFKDKSNYNINPFKYEVTGRIGFGDFCVFANYSMTSLFDDNKGPELYPLTVGISFPNI